MRTKECIFKIGTKTENEDKGYGREFSLNVAGRHIVARSGGTNSSTNEFTFSMKLSRGVTSTSDQWSKAKFDRLHHSL